MTLPQKTQHLATAAAALAAAAVATWVALPAIQAPEPLHIDEGWVLASQLFGSFPFADGWADTASVDRTLPPIHVWVARVFPDGLWGIRAAAWTQGCAAWLLLVFTALRHQGARAALVVGALAILWPSTMAGGSWGVLWLDLCTTGRYDGAGLLAVAVGVATLAEARRSDSRFWWFGAGLAFGLSTLAHAVSAAWLVAGLLVVGAFNGRRLPLWLAGVVGGVGGLAAWLLSGGHAATQWLAQLGRTQMLEPDVVQPLARWSSLASTPDPGGLALVLITMALTVLIPAARTWTGLALAGWGALTVLDPTSGGNYAALFIPAVGLGVGAAAMSEHRPTRLLSTLTAATLAAGGTVATIHSRGTGPWNSQPDPSALHSMIDDDARLLVQMKHWPMLRKYPAVVPYYVMQWQRFPEDARTLSERLDDWCPTHVVRSRGSWPLHIVREEYGGPALQAWLDDAVPVWTPSPVPGFDESVEVGPVRPGHCKPR